MVSLRSEFPSFYHISFPFTVHEKKSLFQTFLRSVRSETTEGGYFPGTIPSGRHGSLLVSALDFRSNSPGSSPGRGTALCSWTRHFTLIVPLSTQVYKWVPANLLLGGINPAMD